MHVYVIQTATTNAYSIATIKINNDDQQHLTVLQRVTKIHRPGLSTMGSLFRACFLNAPPAREMILHRHRQYKTQQTVVVYLEIGPALAA